jgi:pyridoxamine 5'-phosphate oxidase family protein
MSHFTDAELAYLNAQRLGRLGTVGADGMPHLTAVGFTYNPELDTIDIGGRRGGFGASKKFRDAQATAKAAFIVDDVLTDGGRQPRGIEIRGRAEAYATGGDADRPGMDPAFIRIYPTRIVSWGVNEPGYQPSRRTIE